MVEIRGVPGVWLPRLFLQAANARHWYDEWFPLDALDRGGPDRPQMPFLAVLHKEGEKGSRRAAYSDVADIVPYPSAWSPAATEDLHFLMRSASYVARIARTPFSHTMPQTRQRFQSF
jgi:hypothetical protein